MKAASNKSKLDVMNCLNEVIELHPNSISFASGRPSEDFFMVENFPKYIGNFVDYRSRAKGEDKIEVFRKLGQYGKTSGLINNLIAEMLVKDEGILVGEDEILVTNGCQEAMAICLDAIFTERDNLLVVDPTYNGITGLCEIRGISVWNVDQDDEGPSISSIYKALTAIKKAKRQAKAIYLIPDFDNPMGNSITLNRRRQLLQLCKEEKMYVIEDNAYGMFCYRNSRLPTMKSLDSDGLVIYIGTFSKTICPGLRIGYAVTSPELVISFSRVKSLLSVNTSPIAQAVIAGILLENECTLLHYIGPALERYRTNRSLMLSSLNSVSKEFGFDQRICWNMPDGGFFITLKLPFKFDEEEMYDCATNHGVICIPVCFFSNTSKYEKFVRLSFSYVKPSDITEGVRKLAGYISINI